MTFGVIKKIRLPHRKGKQQIAAGTKRSSTRHSRDPILMIIGEASTKRPSQIFAHEGANNLSWIKFRLLLLTERMR